MPLCSDIQHMQAELMPQIPANILQMMQDTTRDLKATGLAGLAIKVGDVAPDFTLSEVGDGQLRLSDVLVKGPVVLNFYRGGWCPYCNLEMQALQRSLPEIERAGGQLLSIAPELPGHAAQTRDKGNLTFPLLHDQDNQVARAYGLVFTLPDELRPVYAGLGIDLVDNQGNDYFELPIPASYIVGKDGVVVFAFVDVDYTQRMEPSRIVEALKGLGS